MSFRHRQFSDIRSRSTSRNHSLTASSIWQRQKSQFQYPETINNHQNCVNCINKKLSQSRFQHNKIIQDREIRQHLQNIKRINQMKDYQKEKRDLMMADSLKHNKSSILLKQQSLKNIKKLEDSEHLKQLQQKEKKYQQMQNSYLTSRKYLQQNYKIQLRQQLQLQQSRKKLSLSQIKSESSLQLNKHKLIEDNEKYVNLIKKQTQICYRQNKRLMTQKSIKKFIESEKNKEEQLRHVQKVQKDFAKFTQYQPLEQSPYRASRTILSRQNNPEDVFTQLKRLQRQKSTKKNLQRKMNNQQRMNEIKKFDQFNRQNVQKKLASMRNYVEDLTNQLIQKRQKQRQNIYYEKYYQPEKSKTDYYTEERQSAVKQCNSCTKILDQKFF